MIPGIRLSSLVYSLPLKELLAYFNEPIGNPAIKHRDGGLPGLPERLAPAVASYSHRRERDCRHARPKDLSLLLDNNEHKILVKTKVLEGKASILIKPLYTII